MSYGFALYLEESLLPLSGVRPHFAFFEIQGDMAKKDKTPI
jgi:hypothetical protein